jgi:Zn finger protein HypA/HybF involved in hydrogenase expression
MQKQDPKEIKREFRQRQTRQIIAMTVALFLVALAAVLYKRPELVGTISRGTLFGMQAITIAAFFGYTSYNWRCPACGKYLGSNLHRTQCRKCSARLQ